MDVSDSGNSEWQADTVAVTIIVTRKTNTITLDTDNQVTTGTVGDTIALLASSTASTAGDTTITYSINVDASDMDADGMITGDMVLLTGSGNLVIDVNDAGDDTEWAVANTRTITIAVSKRANSLTITNGTSHTGEIGDTVTISASSTASTAGATTITYDIDPSNTTPSDAITITGNVVNLDNVVSGGSGFATVSVVDPGNAEWASASGIVSITIDRKTNTINLNLDTQDADGTIDDVIELEATASSGLDPVYTIG